MPLGWLLERFRTRADAEAMVLRDRSVTYGQLTRLVLEAQSLLDHEGVSPGEAALVDADHSPAAVALLLALIARRNIVVPVASHVKADRESYMAIAEVTRSFRVLADDSYEVHKHDRTMGHPLNLELKGQGSPGLVLFSSGSTGRPKAALHNLDLLLRKYMTPRHAKRTVTFLLFDHIGGFNTLFYTLANGGCAIALEGRDPFSLCQAIERHRAQVLPASATFLNLLLMSEAYRQFDLSSLELITYGTEPMPEATLRRLNAAFPQVSFLQTYGLSELGILRSKSRSSDSLWVRVGGEDYQTRVVDGVLHIKAECSMLGYLNAPSPFDAEGWFNTQDEVEVDGEWLRFKGRRSDIINVGGEKVYPAEVESTILEVPGVLDATVSKEPHPITGNIVAASVRLSEAEDPEQATRRIRRHCSAKLPRYKVPVKIKVVETVGVSDRFKKQR